jgi:hypothetical protein
MAFAIMHNFPGGTKEQYEVVLKAVHTNDILPAGQVLHCAGPVADGWQIFAIHDTKASWEKFRDDVLLPSLQAGIEGGFAGPPVEIEIDLESVRVSPQLMEIAQ